MNELVVAKITRADHEMRILDTRWTRAITDWILRWERFFKGTPVRSDFFVKALNKQS